MYVFDDLLSIFQFSIRLSPPSLTPGSLFGSSVSIYEGSEVFIPGNPEAGTVAIGAPGDRINLGSVFVYGTPDVKTTTWILVDTLIPTDDSSSFGKAISIYTDTLAVGAVASTGEGVLYTFLFNTTSNRWMAQTKLSPAESSLGDGFASSLSLYRELTTGLNALVLLSGAPQANSAYVFIFDPRISKWSQNAVLVGTNESVQFGHSVSAYEAILAVGDPGASNGLGRVTIFSAFNSSNRVRWAVQSQVSNK